MKDQLISELFFALGIPLRLNGSIYLRYMLKKFRPGDFITKYLFPECAKEFGNSPRNVERAARYALSFADLSRPEAKKIAGDAEGKLSVGEFFAVGYQFLLMHEKDEAA